MFGAVTAFAMNRWRSDPPRPRVRRPRGIWTRIVTVAFPRPLALRPALAGRAPPVLRTAP